MNTTVPDSMETLEITYTSRLRYFEAEAKRYAKICTLLAWVRLASFLLILLFCYLALTSLLPVLFFCLAGISLIMLMVLIKINSLYTGKRDYSGILVRLCEKELKALRFDFLGFPDGSEFADSEHDFSSDLDIFGNGSAFQYLNRTVTYMGRQELAGWLRNPATDPEEIVNRQNSCREMSILSEWRLHFAATGIGTDVSDNPSSLLQWLKEKELFSLHSLRIRIIQIIQAFMILLIGSVIAGFVNFNFLVLAGLLNLGITGVFLQRINSISRLFGKTYPVLAKYTGLFKKLRDAGFESEWLMKEVHKLFSADSDASREVDALRKYLQQFDSRNNLLVGFFRNALFLTDLMLVIKMEVWRKRNSERIESWLTVLGKADALNSLATFAYNNPDYAYPQPLAGNFSLQAVQLGHPLIPEHERVCNDYQMLGWHRMLVLTGANMAGKSTFLRTIGLNHILAHSGAPVCAESYSFLPSQIITSIRTNDSLIRHESYFYAELRKLKKIIEALEAGRKVFILLDEVLKGTNSNDKLNGSIILIRKILRLNTSGIIATHDISLGDLEKEFPDNISTACFEADISGDQLSFDYTLKTGTARNMTAIFLMKQMGIV